MQAFEKNLNIFSAILLYIKDSYTPSIPNHNHIKAVWNVLIFSYYQVKQNMSLFQLSYNLQHSETGSFKLMSMQSIHTHPHIRKYIITVIRDQIQNIYNPVNEALSYTKYKICLRQRHFLTFNFTETFIKHFNETFFPATSKLASLRKKTCQYGELCSNMTKLLEKLIIFTNEFKK